MFKLLRATSRLLSSLVSLALLAVVGAAVFVIYESRQQQLTPTDAVVVLGAAQFDGEPSPVLANRLDHALQLVVVDKVAPVIITVGGKQPGDRFTEAGAGRRYLIASGIAPDRVVAITRGTDTLSSLRAVAKVARERAYDRVTLVSDPAHVARVKLIAERLGLKAYVAPTEEGPGSGLSVDYLIRETGGILQFLAVAQWDL